MSNKIENKFIKMLSASNAEIKGARAKIVSEDVIDASESLLQKLRKEKRDLERKLLGLSDFNRDSELSLQVVKKNFNAATWITDVQNTKVELANKTIELEIAQSTHDEWFGTNGTDKNLPK